MKKLIFILSILSVVVFAQPGIDLNQDKFTTGTATPTTDLSGEFSITHGLGITPTHLDIGNKSTSEYHFKYDCGATSCTVTVYDGTGTDTVVPSTAVSISWAAFR